MREVSAREEGFVWYLMRRSLRGRRALSDIWCGRSLRMRRALSDILMREVSAREEGFVWYFDAGGPCEWGGLFLIFWCGRCLQGRRALSDIMMREVPANEEGFVWYFDAGGVCEGGGLCLIFFRPMLDTKLYKRVKNIFNYILCRGYHVSRDDESFVESFKRKIPFINIIYHYFLVESRNQVYWVCTQFFIHIENDLNTL